MAWNKEQTMKPTILCGKHLAEHADISGSTFRDVNLAEAEFDDVNLSGARLHNINLSDLTVTAAQIGGSTFSCIGPPPDQEGRQERQRPVTFRNAMLCDSTFEKVDLSGVKIVNCKLDGMTIDGVPVSELMKAHQDRNQ